MKTVIGNTLILLATFSISAALAQGGGHLKLTTVVQKEQVTVLDSGEQQKQLALRIAIKRVKKSFSGKITTSGRFVYMDSTGFFPSEGIKLNEARNELVFDYKDYPKRPILENDEYGINFISPEDDFRKDYSLIPLLSKSIKGHEKEFSGKNK